MQPEYCLRVHFLLSSCKLALWEGKLTLWFTTAAVEAATSSCFQLRAWLCGLETESVVGRILVAGCCIAIVSFGFVRLHYFSITRQRCWLGSRVSFVPFRWRWFYHQADPSWRSGTPHHLGIRALIDTVGSCIPCLVLVVFNPIVQKKPHKNISLYLEPFAALDLLFWWVLSGSCPLDFLF